jgi:glc operon protein GlcG
MKIPGKETPMARLLAAECREFIKAASEKAAEMGVPVSIAIVGPEGHLIALERMDDAGFITPDTARAKAFTVAAFRSMSPRFSDGLVIQQWFKERNPQMMMNASVFTNGQIVASGGCAPVFKGDEMVGAYGISGATSGQDEEIGHHARARVGWAHMAAHDTTPDSVKKHVNEIYASVGLKNRAL